MIIMMIVIRDWDQEIGIWRLDQGLGFWIEIWDWESELGIEIGDQGSVWGMGTQEFKLQIRIGYYDD